MLSAMKEVTPAEGQRLVQQGALLVDVREPDEYEAVHAEGAQLMPLSEFEARASELPKDRPLVMICRSGARSARAGEWLLEQGYSDVVNLQGGTNAWVEDGLPSVHGSGVRGNA
ncbi:Rhodanese-related sulfurtransferase [Deinococcus reticulitermitis]|uniref:Rhodanese-related sulfurtransferase n=2 Tax=Deinococcus reticulitermitis TaxID=856736 RepID=A0A1H6X2F2_9DEIO|nr:Rhodanese-related sulfurtransferase [Deinococcus reticulitermitis]